MNCIANERLYTGKFFGIFMGIPGKSHIMGFGMGFSHSHSLVEGYSHLPFFLKGHPDFDGMGIPSHSHRDYPIPTVSLVTAPG